VLQPLPFAQQCALAAALGYDALEVAPFTLAADPMAITEAQAASSPHRPKTTAWPSAACTGCWWRRPGCRSSAPMPRCADRTTAVMERLVGCAPLMGGRYLVHGSPKQRSVPAGETAPPRTGPRTRMPGPRRARAEACGVTYCLEPLATCETDFVNTVAEAVAWSRSARPRSRP
jgi:D-psicose/D-tagatose/L-ribulose 3-epimerase